MIFDFTCILCVSSSVVSCVSVEMRTAIPGLGQNWDRCTPVVFVRNQQCLSAD